MLPTREKRVGNEVLYQQVRVTKLITSLRVGESPSPFQGCRSESPEGGPYSCFNFHLRTKKSCLGCQVNWSNNFAFECYFFTVFVAFAMALTLRLLL